MNLARIAPGTLVQMPTVQLYSADDWKNGLRHAVKSGRRVVFVVGAGLSRHDSKGAWGVGQILEHVDRAYPLAKFPKEPAAEAYQKAMGAVMANYSSDEVERTIRLAVLAAAKEGEAQRRARNDLEQAKDPRVPASCRELQANPGAWNLPQGVVALAELLAFLAERARRDPGAQYPCVLSTNFDGLLEAALAAQGIRCEPTVVPRDEFPRDLDQRLSIVHVHGYWLSEPTLHDAKALEAGRDGLQAALRALLQAATVFVVGYGGWNDIVFGTTKTMLQRQQANTLPEVKWAFFSGEEKLRADEGNSRSPCGHVIEKLAETARTSFYCGVNVHRDLPEAVAGIVGRPAPLALDDSTGASVPTPEMLRLMQALVSTVPKRHQEWFAPLQAEAEQGRPVNLAAVVGTCCATLEEGKMAPAEHRGFSEAAWDLITFMTSDLVGKMKSRFLPHAPGDKPGEILAVPVRSHFLVALLLARNPDPRRLLLPSSFGAVSPHDHSRLARFLPFETGPAKVDRVFQFEALLWKDLFPAEPAYVLGCTEAACVTGNCARDCDRRPLYGRLGADAAKGQPHFWVIDPGMADKWSEIAAKAKEVVFVEPGVGATIGIDEDRLAVLISDFLKLSTSKETP
jgi:hypothetical protein